MLTLVQPGPQWGLPSHNPFCVAVQVPHWMASAGVNSTTRARCVRQAYLRFIGTEFGVENLPRSACSVLERTSEEAWSCLAACPSRLASQTSVQTSYPS